MRTVGPVRCVSHNTVWYSWPIRTEDPHKCTILSLLGDGSKGEPTCWNAQRSVERTPEQIQTDPSHGRETARLHNVCHQIEEINRLIEEMAAYLDGAETSEQAHLGRSSCGRQGYSATARSVLKDPFRDLVEAYTFTATLHLADREQPFQSSGEADIMHSLLERERR